MLCEAIAIAALVSLMIYVYDCVRAGRLVFIHETKDESKPIRIISSLFISIFEFVLLTFVLSVIFVGIIGVLGAAALLCMISPAILICLILLISK